jgi:hypothetical protein
VVFGGADEFFFGVGEFWPVICDGFRLGCYFIDSSFHIGYWRTQVISLDRIQDILGTEC